MGSDINSKSVGDETENVAYHGRKPGPAGHTDWVARDSFGDAGEVDADRKRAALHTTQTMVGSKYPEHVEESKNEATKFTPRTDQEAEDSGVDGEVRSILEQVQITETENKYQTAPHDDASLLPMPGDQHEQDPDPGSLKSLQAEAESATNTPKEQKNNGDDGTDRSKAFPESIGSPPASRATNLTVELNRSSLPPEPEPEVRFNFHLFLEQLRHRTADPVARYLRSFLVEFGKKQWTVHEQVRIITDFLAFISGKMAHCDIWREATESEFDNAREGMEKLVMNRLYSQIFSPEIPLSYSASTTDRGRKRTPKQPSPGRRGQHQEDVERDNVLSEKMQIFGWVEEQHLDIRPVKTDGSKRFLSLAQQELCKINNYRAPRDKVICILNACKVIFGLLRSSKETDTSADAFMPLLIYTVLRAKPQHMVSNIQYIFRFRNQDKLGGEAGYYLSSLMGAVQFIETLDRTALSITDKEFEERVEHSVAAIAERRSESTQQHAKDSIPGPLLGLEDTSLSVSRSPSRLRLGDPDGPVSGIIRNIQRPLSNLGRMFSDETTDSGIGETTDNAISRTTNQRSDQSQQDANISRNKQIEREGDRRRLQVDGDVNSIVETLSSMFPTLDKDIISDIVIAKDAKVGPAVDACLNMTS